MLSDKDVQRLQEAEENIKRIKAELEIKSRTQVFYRRNNGKKIFEEYCKPFGRYCYLLKYDVIYKRDLQYYADEKRFYATPYGETPLKQYRGVDRSDYLLYEFSHDWPPLLKIKEYDMIVYLLNNNMDITDPKHIQIINKKINQDNKYELIYVCGSAYNGAIPEGFEFAGYDVCYEPRFRGSFSIIRDCMFNRTAYGCDKDGTLFISDFEKLNDNGLFSDADDAYSYMVKYLSQKWSATGSFFIVKVYLKRKT